MQLHIHKRAWIIIYITIAASYTTGCLPTTYLEYDKPDLPLQASKGSFIGKDKLQILDILGPPDDVFTKLPSTSYYVYTHGPGKAIPFLVLMLPLPFPIELTHCLLLEFDKYDVMQNYRDIREVDYQMQFSYETCSDLFKQIEPTLTPSSAEYMMHEVKLGNQMAMYALYEQSKGLSHRTDFRWLCASADKGYYKARWEIGSIYFNGIYGLKSDLVLSLVWYSLAGPDRGDRNVYRNVEYLRNTLTPEQLSHVDNLIKNWKPGLCAKELIGK